MQFFILCFYVVPSSTTTAPPTEQTTKTTSSEKISSSGNEKPQGTAQLRKGNQKTELKNTPVKILFSLALLSGLFTAPLLKIHLLCFLSFWPKGMDYNTGGFLVLIKLRKTCCLSLNIKPVCFQFSFLMIDFLWFLLFYLSL